MLKLNTHYSKWQQYLLNKLVYKLFICIIFYKIKLNSYTIFITEVEKNSSYEITIIYFININLWLTV